IFAHHLAHAPAARHAPLRSSSAMIDRAWVRWVRNVVRTAVGDACRYLRTVATDKLVREIVREIGAPSNGYRAVSVGAIADHECPIPQNSGAWNILAEVVAHVRIVEEENAVAQNVCEHSLGGIVAFNLHLKHAAIRAIFGLNLHRESWTRARDHERFFRTVDLDVAVQD